MILIFENHPVQYRAPLYAEIERVEGGRIHVVYRSVDSVKGYVDKEFGKEVSWDVPLLEGYSYESIHPNNLLFKSLFKVINHPEVSAIYLTGYSKMHICASIIALLLGKSVSIRVETQDYAFQRSPLKTFFRSLLYRTIYAPISRAYYIGSLNKQHLIKHGFSNRQLFWMPYVVGNPIGKLSTAEKTEIRTNIREKIQVSVDTKVVGFFGKLIPKKNPILLLEAYLQLNPSERKPFHFLFVGSGEDEAKLKEIVAKHQIPATFTGFVNQSEIHDYYLASDITSLPSRQMGETWGLVVNEGLQAGNSVLISNFVGSSADLGSWEQVAVFESENASDLAEKLKSLATFPHNFDWCSQMLKEQYSIESTAKCFLKSLETSQGFQIQTSTHSI